MKSNRDKEIRDLVKNLISKTEYKNVNKVRDENDYSSDGFGIFIGGQNENLPQDPLHEEVWEGDIDIKIIRRDGDYVDSSGYNRRYDLIINDDKIKNFEYGKSLYKILREKYELKKKDNKSEKISRIIKKLEKNA